MVHVTQDTGYSGICCQVMKCLPYPPLLIPTNSQLLACFFDCLGLELTLLKSYLLHCRNHLLVTVPLELVTESVCGVRPSVHYCHLPGLNFVCCPATLMVSLTSGLQFSTVGLCPCGSEQYPQPYVSPCTYFILLVSGDVQASLSLGGLAWTL